MVTELAEAPGTETVCAPDFSIFVGKSPALQSVLDTISNLLDNDSTVLVLGESGTGKELIARAIHYNSNRNQYPLVTVNCGAIPEELLESELFGHEKGAFTGAIRTRIGKFELADKGTIFLDEIGDMSPTLQIKLLRVLQEHEFDRVGGNRTMKVSVRIIAATNQNLEKAIEEGRFREDLYYRLNVIPIEVPALRFRGDDISLLVTHFIKNFNALKNRNISGMSQEAINLLRAYTWPGNIRELEHMIERLVVLKASGVIEKQDLPPKLQNLELPPDDQLSKDMLLVGDPDELAEERLSAPAIKIAQPPNGSPDNVGARSNIIENHPGRTDADFQIEDSPTLPEEGINLKEAVDRYETALILAALDRCGWVKNKAANLLGLNRTTLVEKLKKKKLVRTEG